MSESQVQKDILAAIRAARPRVEPMRLNSGTAKGGKIRLAPDGTPDILCVLPPRGRSGWLEVKTSSGKLRPSQQKWRDRFLRTGTGYAVVRSVREALEAVDSWLTAEDDLSKRLRGD